MNRKDLLTSYDSVRGTTENICAPLSVEDYVIQSMTDVSPPKWHLGHTSWFFEQVILERYLPDYQRWNERYYFVFNSYYQSFGDRVARDIRGTLSRPTVKDVYDYRSVVNDRMRSLITTIDEERYPEFAALVELGLHHEQQHTELLVTDIKHILAMNPLRPSYRSGWSRPGQQTPQSGQRKPLGSSFRKFIGGVHEFGAGGEGFVWDNERPRHKAYIGDFALLDRLVTCGEYLEFMNEGGYRDPLLWLSDGWDTSVRNQWDSPMYWERHDETWFVMTLDGLRPVKAEEPVTHVSYYEAAAFARWAGKRLPTEYEWEHASAAVRSDPSCGNFLETGNFHPLPVGEAPGADPDGLSQMFGDVWEWTGSAYLGYPGYTQERGPLGEYNGKFMSNQMVLRGGSCATPRTHIRPTYRNFFQCDKRWQFTGFRLATDTK
jgi:ergothioneine biosynthesis protein EgtB